MADRPPADPITLRFWPWLAMCASGAIVFGGLAWYVTYVMARTSGVAPFVIGAIFFAGFAALASYCLASLRTRSVLDSTGCTARSAFSRTHVPWSQVQRLDVSHTLPGWSVRAWQPDGRPAVVFMCHDTYGSGRRRTEAFEQPPVQAPRAVRQGYAVIERYWRAWASRQ